MKSMLPLLLFIAAFSMNNIQASHDHHHHHSDTDKDNPPCNHESLEDARRALEGN